jgi:MAF protein/D-tyrosyl-tRNA(Tyr) deacylase
MRAVIQRTNSASVAVAGRTIGAIDRGLLALVAVRKGDAEEDAEWLARKITELRIFPDERGRMNRSVVETAGGVLLVSQFTLYGDVRRGRRPSFDAAARPEEAVRLLESLKRRIETAGATVATGEFGAHMTVELVNDGPVTLVLDSEERSRGAPRAARASARPAGSVPSGRFRLLHGDSPLHGIPLVLASASPRRRDLLSDLGLSFTTAPPDVDEDLDPTGDAAEQAGVLAERKARSVRPGPGECIVLAADTIVALEKHVLGKPADEADAIRMLSELSGKEHTVVTGVCAALAPSGVCRTRVVSTRVRFREMGTEEIRRYVATGEPLGKAGAYAIQGLGGLLVSGIDGDYSNVVGLPLGATLDLLEEIVTARDGARARGGS